MLTLCCYGNHHLHSHFIDDGTETQRALWFARGDLTPPLKGDREGLGRGRWRGQAETLLPHPAEGGGRLPACSSEGSLSHSPTLSA